MKHRLLVVCATVAVLMFHASPAQAGLWAWLEEFSGPGPSHGTAEMLFLPTTFCKYKPLPPLPSFGLSLPPGREAAWCVFADYGRFEAPAERGFPEVVTTKIDFGPTFLFWKGIVDVGAGFGVMQVDSAVSPKAYQPIVTPIRVGTRPLFFIRYIDRSSRKLERVSNVLKFYVRGTFVLGELTGADFGAEPESEAGRFRVTNDFVRSYNAVIDLSELIN